MTPQERDLVTHLLARLKQNGNQQKDPEAEALLRQAMSEQPDAPYYLVQTVLIQDMALSSAQNRIAELERQLAAGQQQQQQQSGGGHSFLGGLLGGGQPARQSAPPSAGPWGPHPTSNPGPARGPWGGGYSAPQPMMAQSASSGFLRSAAATAAGVAGGALLFEGIRSMFGDNAGGILSNAAMQPGLSETVINNYYETDPNAAAGGDTQTADWDQTAPDPGADAGDQDVAADQDFDSDDQDVASDADFGGDDGDYV